MTDLETPSANISRRLLEWESGPDLRGPFLARMRGVISSVGTTSPRWPTDIRRIHHRENSPRAGKWSECVQACEWTWNAADSVTGGNSLSRPDHKNVLTVRARMSSSRLAAMNVLLTHEYIVGRRNTPFSSFVSSSLVLLKRQNKAVTKSRRYFDLIDLETMLQTLRSCKKTRYTYNYGQLYPQIYW